MDVVCKVPDQAKRKALLAMQSAQSVLTTDSISKREIRSLAETIQTLANVVSQLSFLLWTSTEATAIPAVDGDRSTA